MKDHEQKM